MKHRIVVLGAGYAGTHAAGRLARRLHPDDTEITLVNADPDFVERVRMHQLATGQQLPPRDLVDVVAGTGIEVRTARVTAVDTDARTVELVDRHGTDRIAYDTLVYALGSTTDDHGVPGVVRYAHQVAGRQAALRLRDRLAELTAGASVLVVGGGLTAIELSTEIAESRPDLDVAIAAGHGVGEWLSDRAGRHLSGALDRLGITVHPHTEVTAVEQTGVLTAAGRRIPAEVTVWTAGFAVHPIAAASTLRVSTTGRIVVDGSMRSVSHPAVYAVGDAAIADGVGGTPLRMSCASGIPMAWRAADAIAARLTGRAVADKAVRYYIQCISIGRRDGILQSVTPDDRVRSLVIAGRAGARLKEWVCAGAAWSIAHPTAMLPSRRRRIAANRPAELSAVS